MTIGSWDPNSKPSNISLESVLAAIELLQNNAFPEQAPEALLTLKPFAKSEQALWEDTFAQLDDDQLRNLARFFTLAEAKWTDWFGGDKNPVIWICKALKKRGAFPDKDLTSWIKQNTDNRFLPYGNALG